jgi:MFS family permease
LGASATALSALGMLQLGLYAAMQVPVGVLLDRFGTRRMVTAGALVMAVSQAVLGVADDVPTAVAARALLGVGDAMTFISVLRLIPAWFAPQRAPVLTQLTGLLGGLGQVAASYPLVALLAGPEDGRGARPGRRRLHGARRAGHPRARAARAAAAGAPGAPG